jgi:hypothetical protein
MFFLSIFQSFQQNIFFLSTSFLIYFFKNKKKKTQMTVQLTHCPECGMMCSNFQPFIDSMRSAQMPFHMINEIFRIDLPCCQNVFMTRMNIPLLRSHYIAMAEIQMRLQLEKDQKEETTENDVEEIKSENHSEKQTVREAEEREPNENMIEKQSQKRKADQEGDFSNKKKKRVDGD